MYLINYKLYNDMNEKISETEEKIGWSFPEDYISFIRKYNYAVFGNAYFNDLEFQIKSLLNIDSGIVNSVYKSGLKVNKALNNVEYKMVPIIIAENEREKYASRICYNKEDDKLYLVSYNYIPTSTKKIKKKMADTPPPLKRTISSAQIFLQESKASIIPPEIAVPNTPARFGPIACMRRNTFLLSCCPTR